jgi:hypothetical protein
MQKAIVLRRTPSASSRSINRTVTAILHSLTRDVAVHSGATFPKRSLGSGALAWAANGRTGPTCTICAAPARLGTPNTTISRAIFGRFAPSKCKKFCRLRLVPVAIVGRSGRAANITAPLAALPHHL